MLNTLFLMSTIQIFEYSHYLSPQTFHSFNNDYLESAMCWEMSGSWDTSVNTPMPSVPSWGLESGQKTDVKQET